MSLNRVTLVGRLTRDPELKYTPQGVPVASMGIAVNRFTKNESGDYDVDFFNITAWRRTAEFANNYLKKGRLVSVDGKLQARSWVDAASGQKRTSVEIVAEDIQGLDKRTDGEASGAEESYGGGENYSAPAAPVATQASAPAARASAPAARPSRPAPPPVDDNDEADPFADE